MEKTELLTVYDENLNPVGTKTRAEVHANELLHMTIRLWTIVDDKIWFQRRALDKALFPGRYDLSATGHIDPGEAPENAVRREMLEETGIDLSKSYIKFAGAIPFGFYRPDGKLDNEFANIYVFTPKEIPDFQTSDEVMGLAAVTLQDYDRLLRTGGPIPVTTYWPDPEHVAPVRTGERTCGPDSFCCLNQREWELVLKAIGLNKNDLK